MIAAVVGLVGAVVILVQELRRRRLAEELALALATQDVLENTAAGLERAMETKRREYARALERVAACEDPVATRYLVHELLRDPWLGEVPSSPRP